MARMSQTVKEIIQIVVFLLVVGILITVFLIYPLNRTKAILGRPDLDEFDFDSLPANDPTSFVEAGLVVDTFRIDADGLTNLACLYALPQPDSLDDSAAVVPVGSVILLHDEREDRNDMIPLTRQLTENGYLVCIYDQRATGLSSGEYHGDGQAESSDLAEVIAYMAVRDLIHHPLTVVGFGNGADAALLRAREESRIDEVVAVNPYLTSDRWYDMLRAEHGMFWIPFGYTVFTFWYEMRSNYEIPDRELESLEVVEHPTLVFVAPDQVENETVVTFEEISDSGMLTLSPLPENRDDLRAAIVEFVQTHKPSDQP